MSIDYTGFAIPKPRPRAAERDARKATVEKTDERESKKARIRANGQCEVRLVDSPQCPRKDMHTHHLIGGIGRRNRGKSILAEYKLRVCDKCHEAITGKTLKPTTAEHTAYTVRYRRDR